MTLIHASFLVVSFETKEAQLSLYQRDIIDRSITIIKLFCQWKKLFAVQFALFEHPRFLFAQYGIWCLTVKLPKIISQNLLPAN